MPINKGARTDAEIDSFEAALILSGFRPISLNLKEREAEISGSCIPKPNPNLFPCIILEPKCKTTVQDCS
jgi:hypothetical protein